MNDIMPGDIVTHVEHRGFAGLVVQTGVRLIQSSDDLVKVLWFLNVAGERFDLQFPSLGFFLDEVCKRDRLLKIA